MRRTFVVGLAGGSGSGKTTLARAVRDALGRERCGCLSVDAYYRDALAPGPDGNINFDHPDAIEFSLLADHLNALHAGLAIEAPTYDFATHRRLKATETVRPAPFLVLEGILLLCAEAVRAQIDFAVFVEAPEAVRHARRLARDMAERGRSAASVHAQIEATVAPMYRAHVGPSQCWADRIVSGESDLPRIAAELAATIEARAAAQGQVLP